MRATKTATFSDLTPIEDKGRRTNRKPVLKPKAKPVDPIRRWASAGVGLTLCLSGWLNGMAFSQSAPNAFCGWMLGIAIPILVLVFSRVSALLYGANQRVLSYFGAGATLSILLLSVQHCAVSIAALTGEHVALSALMSIAIDCGLIICEVAIVLRKSRN